MGCAEDTGPVGSIVGADTESDRPVEHLTEAVDEAADISSGHESGRPGSSAMPDPPVAEASAPPTPTVEVPGERPDNLP